MIEQDLKAYLDKADIYIINSIEYIELASRIYGQYIDSSGFKPDLAIMVKELYINIEKIYLDITDYVINDLAPDPYQDLDLSIRTFISTCHNCIFFLTKLAEKEEVHHWLIKKNFEDCQKEYKKLFNNRKLPDICALSSYHLPVALKIDPDSRILLSIYQRLDESKITCIDLWLSGEINSIQLNIELMIKDIEKYCLLNLAFRCANAVKEELLSLSSVKVIFISFQTTEGLHACWIRGSKDSILSFISRNTNLKEFEKVLFICYLGDVLLAAQKLDDLAKHSSFITKDFEIKEVLLEAAKHLEFLAKKAASDLDSLTDLTMKWSFQSSLLSCMLVVSRVISVTKDNDIAKQFIQFFGIFHGPNDVNVSQDYLNLFHNISIIIDMLKMRYIVIPNLRKISLGMEISQSPRIAVVQPKISINKDYKNFQLTKDGSIRHLNIFDENVEIAKRQSASGIIFPEMFFPASQIEYLRKKSEENHLIIITGLDYEYDKSGNPINSCAISLPDGSLVKQRKLYASKYDLPSMIRGEDISVFCESAIGNFSVFICFDYLSPQDLIKLRGIADVLFVLTLNPDVRAYHEKAKADAYSYLYGFIIIVNAFDPCYSPPIRGGSGFYGPLKEERIIKRFEKGKYGMMIAEMPLII